MTKIRFVKYKRNNVDSQIEELSFPSLPLRDSLWFPTGATMVQKSENQ